MNPVLRYLFPITLIFTACAQPTQVEWQELPENVMIAGPASAFEVKASAGVKEVPVPIDRLPAKGEDLERLELLQVFADRLERVPMQFAQGRLIGDFSGGGRYILHYPFDTSIFSKYTLFCRLKAVRFRLDVLDDQLLGNRLCPVILCPADPYFAIDLFDEFTMLREFSDQFPMDEMGGMQINPLPDVDGFGNICDQCFGRNWDTVLVPDCHDIGPVNQCWRARGPSPNTRGQVENITDREVVGAVNAVTPHPTDADILYVGAVNGGVWQTNDATAANPNWTQRTDSEASLSIGALEFDPTDATNETLVAGTGRFSSLGRQGGDRVGLLRTTDGGINWDQLDGGGTLQGLNISGVAPRGATIVLSVDTPNNGASRGIWRSTDTGASFTQVSGAAGSGLPNGRSFDLASDPTNNARLYTHAGGAGIFRSDDTGATWTSVSNAAMNALLAFGGNVEISVGDNSNVYVAIVTAGTLGGLFRSGNNGGTWTALDLPQTTENGGANFGAHPGGQGNLHLSIAADFNDDNVVYIGGDRQPCWTEALGCPRPNPMAVPPIPPVFPNASGANDFSGRLFRIDASQPSGSQVTALTHSGTASNSSPHADSRDMDMRADGVLIEGDDGGVYSRTSPRSAAGDWFSINGDLQTTEFHNIAWDAVSGVIIGGAQDTGTPQQTNPPTWTWRSVSTGDGGDVAVDDTSTIGQSVRYSSFQFMGAFRRQVYDATGTFQSQVFPNLAIQPPQPVGVPPAWQFYTPIEVNNEDPTRLILGAANGVYETVDQGNTVSRIGVGIVVNDNGNNDAIAYGSDGNADMLYVGSGAQVFIRNAVPPAALNASAAYNALPNGGIVVDIAIDPDDPNVAFVVDNNNIFHTTDGGGSWTDVTGNFGTLNAGNITAVAFRSVGTELIAVGTDTGVFSAEGADFDFWSEHACGLPRVPVYDLDYDPVDRIFVAGTFGRGAWTIED